MLPATGAARCALEGPGPGRAAALARSPHLHNLTRLDLHRNFITDAGARILLTSPGLVKLTDLNVRDNPVSESLRESLRKRYPGPAPE